MGKQKYAVIKCTGCASGNEKIIKGTVECKTEAEFQEQELVLAKQNGWKIMKHEEKRNHEPTRIWYRYKCPDCVAFDKEERVRFLELIERAKKDYGIEFVGEPIDICGWAIHYKSWRVMLWGRGSGSDAGAYYRKEDAERVAEIAQKSHKEVLHNTKVRIELEEGNDLISLWGLRELYGIPLSVKK